MIQQQHLKTIILHLETVSPILVWSGEELVFDENNKKVIVGDEADLKLFENNFGNIPVELGKCISGNCKDFKLFSYYVNSDGKRVRYLPGSSVKGLLRSVVGKYILDEILKVSFKKIKGKITGKSEINFGNKYFETFFKNLLNSKNKKIDKNELIHLGDFKDIFNYFLDLIFRNIIVKDVVLPDDGFSIYLAKNLHREPEFRRGNGDKYPIHTWFEGFSGSVGIEIKVNNFQIKQNLGKIYSKLGIDFENREDRNKMFGYYAKELKKVIENRIDQDIAPNKVKELKNKIKELKNKIPNSKEDNKYLVRLGFWKHEETYKFVDVFNHCSIWGIYNSKDDKDFTLSSFVKVKITEDIKRE